MASCMHQAAVHPSAAVQELAVAHILESAMGQAVALRLAAGDQLLAMPSLQQTAGPVAAVAAVAVEAAAAADVAVAAVVAVGGEGAAVAVERPVDVGDAVAVDAEQAGQGSVVLGIQEAFAHEGIRGLWERRGPCADLCCKDTNTVRSPERPELGLAMMPFSSCQHPVRRQAHETRGWWSRPS